MTEGKQEYDIPEKLKQAIYEDKIDEIDRGYALMTRKIEILTAKVENLLKV